MRISRRRLLGAAVAAAFMSPAPTSPAPKSSVPASPAPTPRGRRVSRPPVLNDASRLNSTPIAAHRIVRTDDERRYVEDVRTLLREAAREGHPVSVGGARHSMGGQSLPRNGIAASLSLPKCEPDTAARIYRVRSGTRWNHVIGTLDPLGFSVAVMQSNSDFSVGGTLSVNAHSWPVPYGPFGTTVRALRLMLADGSVVTCSRTENAELFSLVIGGYGLFGIVLDADVGTADNMLLLPTFERMPAARVAERFVATVRDAPVRMAYARLSVAARGFLEDAFVTSYRPVATQPEPLPPANRSAAYTFLSRQALRRQVGSERGKQARWYAETMLPPRFAAKRPLTRNTILSYPVSALAETSRRRTDILHEYFIPPERFGEFLAACCELIPPSKQDLLNVTLRFVDTDPVSVLSFAPAPRIAAVLLFSQGVSGEADRAMAALTEQLIDAVLAIGGSFYLPYRLHARADQLRRAYPRLDTFIAKKREYDPQLRFRNLMWDRYLA
ncbi:MAG TPA: FAD-binding protein [Xanthobacteraceae bacterium]|nr:FAD-binding protein [Xanthobacteraceae bacterium]